MQVTILDKPDMKDAVENIETVSSWKWQISLSEESKSHRQPNLLKKNFNRPCSLHFELGWSGAPRGLHGWLPNRPLSKTHKNTGDHPPGFSLHRCKLKILLESMDMVQSGASSSAWWRTSQRPPWHVFGLYKNPGRAMSETVIGGKQVRRCC